MTLSLKDLYIYAAAVINCGTSIVCCLQQHSGKRIMMLRNIYKIKQVLIMLNGRVKHV